MTRLYHEMIKDLPQSLPDLDQNLQKSTGLSLLGIAARTTSLPVSILREKLKEYSSAVIPISAGKGIIPGFVDSVAAILNYVGLNSSITCQSDVAGLGEALSSKADLLFAADDHQFLAMDLRKRKVIENPWATASGFVEALAAATEKFAQGLKGREVLVLGLGPVGALAARRLQTLGASLWVYDLDVRKMETFVGQFPSAQTPTSLKGALTFIDLIFDATPAPNIIESYMIRPKTVIVSPGVPHGLTPAALQAIGSRFIHDPLAIGVAVMAIQALFPCKENCGK